MDAQIGAEAVRVLLAQHRCIECVSPGNGRVLIEKSAPGICYVYRWTNEQPSNGLEIYNDIPAALDALEKQGWLDEKHRWSPREAGGLPPERSPLWNADMGDVPVDVSPLAALLRREYEDGCHNRIVPGGLVSLTDHYQSGRLPYDPLPLPVTTGLRAYGSIPIHIRPRVIEGLWKLLHGQPLDDRDRDWRAEIQRVYDEDVRSMPTARTLGIMSHPRYGTVHQLRMMPYRRYLQSGHWQSVRGAALVRAGWRCQRCSSQISLEVHHRTYKRRGHEHASDLVVLCAVCHGSFHKRVGWVPFADRYLSSKRGFRDLVEVILLWGAIICVAIAYYHVHF